MKKSIAKFLAVVVSGVLLLGTYACSTETKPTPKDPPKVDTKMPGSMPTGDKPK